MTLRKHRLDAGMTQAELGAAVGLSQQAIAHYENGRRKISGLVARGIIKALESRGITVTLDELV